MPLPKALCYISFDCVYPILVLSAFTEESNAIYTRVRVRADHILSTTAFINEVAMHRDFAVVCPLIDPTALPQLSVE